MTQVDWNTLVIMGTIASAAGLSMLWLQTQFRRLEKNFYAELERHRIKNDGTFQDHRDRIQKLELKNFGFTKHP